MTLAKGAIAKPIVVVGLRELSRDELALLKERRSTPTNVPQRLRDSHHRIARLAASGLRVGPIASRVGMSYNRVATLLNSPAMAELIARYREKVDEAWKESEDEFYAVATSNMLKAERQIADRLDEADEEGETLPVRELVAISRDAADRFGYGKKQTNVNLNVDFAAQLERAIARSGKTIEASVVNQPARQSLAGTSSPSPLPTRQAVDSPQPLRRLA